MVTFKCSKKWISLSSIFAYNFPARRNFEFMTLYGFYYCQEEE